MEPNSSDQRTAFRMLDANINRFQEAIRTLEDLARFSDLAILQRDYKGLRHRVQQTTQCWDFAELLHARCAEEDVGRDVKMESELDRSGGTLDIAFAAASRSQQALRCMEEIAKFVFPENSRVIELCRYELYDLNAKLILSMQRDLDRLRKANLYLLVDCQLPLSQFSDRIHEVASAGVDLIQLREKSKETRELIAYTESAMKAIEGMPCRILVNDRCDIAAVTRAMGVHVGQTDMKISDARKLLPPTGVVGLSTHNLEQLQDAIDCGADYVGCGPTFASATKEFQSFSGVSFLREASRVAGQGAISAFAIGGIQLENLKTVLETGFTKVAVSSAIWRADRPSEIVRRFKESLS